MNEIVTNYCKVKGIDPCEVLNSSREQKVVVLRSALMYLVWEERKKTISYDNPKSKVIREIGAEFGMKRVSTYERIKKFEYELEIYKERRFLLDEVKSVLNENPLQS